MLTVLSPYRYRASVYRGHPGYFFKEGFFEVYTVKIDKCPYLGEAFASSSSIFSGSSPRMTSASSPISSTSQSMIALPLLFLSLCTYSSDIYHFQKRLDRKETIPVITHINLGHGSLEF